MTFHIIVEGVDRVGKDTFIDKLRRELDGVTVMIHNGPPPRELQSSLHKSYAMRDTYQDQTTALKHFNGTIVWNRLHLSSTVYDSTLRRLHFSRDIFRISEERIALDTDKTFIIVLDHPAHNLAGVDDGHSTWTRPDSDTTVLAIRQEQYMFKQCLAWSRYRGAVIDPRVPGVAKETAVMIRRFQALKEVRN